MFKLLLQSPFVFYFPVLCSSEQKKNALLFATIITFLQLLGLKKLKIRQMQKLLALLVKEVPL